MRARTIFILEKTKIICDLIDKQLDLSFQIRELERQKENLEIRLQDEAEQINRKLTPQLKIPPNTKESTFEVAQKIFN